MKSEKEGETIFCGVFIQLTHILWFKSPYFWTYILGEWHENLSDGEKVDYLRRILEANGLEVK